MKNNLPEDRYTTEEDLREELEKLNKYLFFSLRNYLFVGNSYKESKALVIRDIKWAIVDLHKEGKI